MSEPHRSWACHLCGEGQVVPVPGYSRFRRVTSDCRPWRFGGSLGVCRFCASVVKAVDASWQREVDEIYSSYDIFHQSAGSEQLVYSRDQGAARFRSDPLVEKLRTVLPLPDRGRLLDVGCGKGAFLRAWSRAFPAWELEGSDIDSSTAEVVKAIPQVRAMHTNGLRSIENSFDLISMVHVLEHVPHPADFLRAARERLNETGWLFIEVPHYAERAFDLLVADHCSHLTPDSINRLLLASGLESITLSQEWSAKEVSGVFRPREGVSLPLPERSSFRESFHCVARCLVWLEQTLSVAQRTQSQSRGSFGVFGTSIGATWLASSLDRPVDFFVDEDPSRQGRLHLNKPILRPSEVSSAATVCMCLPYRQAQEVDDRLSGPARGWQTLLPPLPA